MTLISLMSVPLYGEHEEGHHLFQDEEERKAIKDALKKGKEKNDGPEKADVSLEKHEIYTLVALIYTSPTSWSLWMEKTLYHQDHCRINENITLRPLNAQMVELTDQGVKNILFPGQSYDPKTKTIVSR